MVFRLLMIPLILLCASLDALAQERKLALLVGVTDYLNTEIPPLAGPGNDAELLAEALVNRGFDPANIRTLSESPESYEPPLHRNILDGFDWLAEEAADGDTVLVLLAGHGSIQPNDNPAEDPEPDGLDEVFLPKDTGSRDELLRYKRGLVDDVIAERLDAIRAKGAFVIFIADSCRSETQNRAGSSVERPLADVSNRQTRYVSPFESLSEQDIRRFVDLTEEARTAALGRDSGESRDVWTDGRSDRGDFVALFASQAHEAAPEEILPRRTGIDVYGVFSFHLAAALMNYQELSWGEILELVRQDYRRLNLQVPTPVGEGALEAKVFGAGTRNRILQWPVFHVGGDAMIRAGRLQSLREGAVLTLYADPVSWDEEKIVGYATIETIALTRSTLKPVARDGVMLEAIPSNVFARTNQSSFSYELTVATPEVLDTPSRDERLVALALDHLKQERSEMVDLAFVPQGTAADISLYVDDGRLWFIPPSGELVRNGPAKTVSLEISARTADSPSNLDVLEQRIAVELVLVKIAKAVGLAELVEVLESADLTDHLQIEVVVKRGSAAPASATSGLAELAGPVDVHDGDTLSISVTNAGTTAMDLTIIHVASNYETACLFPRLAMGELNRVQATQSQVIYDLQVTTETVGTESLVFLATQAVPLERPNLCLLAESTARGQVRLSAVLGARQRSPGEAGEAQTLAGGKSVLLEIMDQEAPQ